MAGRVKGVATQPCPQCGADLSVVTQTDGGLSTETCGNCFPSATPETASAQPQPSRERGTTQEA